MSGNSKWVLGHKIRPLETDASYGMVEVTSPPKIPGPPPHYHKHENEFFYIIKGTLDVMCNGQWQQHHAGSFVELPPNTTHTFINNSSADTIWITGWRPKGFEAFFHDFGISSLEPHAQSKSVADELIQRVLQDVEKYGMYIDTNLT